MLLCVGALALRDAVLRKPQPLHLVLTEGFFWQHHAHCHWSPGMEGAAAPLSFLEIAASAGGVHFHGISVGNDGEDERCEAGGSRERQSEAHAIGQRMRWVPHRPMGYSWDPSCPMGGAGKES